LSVQENKEGLELLKSAIAKAGYTGKVSIFISSKFCLWCFGFSGVFFYTTLKIAIMFLGCHWNGCCCFRILQGRQNIRFELQGRCELFII